MPGPDVGFEVAEPEEELIPAEIRIFFSRELSESITIPDSIAKLDKFGIKNISESISLNVELNKNATEDRRGKGITMAKYMDDIKQKERVIIEKPLG